MMNRIGRGNEEWVSSPEPWVRGPQGGGPGPGSTGSGPGGTKVRGSGWRSATGRSYGRRRLAGSGWTRASAPSARKPGATCVAHAPTPAPGSAPPPGSAHLPVAPTSRLRRPARVLVGHHAGALNCAPPRDGEGGRWAGQGRGVAAPWQSLYFLPEPHGQGWLRPTFLTPWRWGWVGAARSSASVTAEESWVGWGAGA